MKYEVIESKTSINGDEWRVEAIDHEHEGECYVAIFSGPQAEQRAKAYAAMMNTPAARFNTLKSLPRR